MPILVCERGSEKGLTCKIEPGKGYVCGRDPASTHITLTDVMTSRRHFEIRAEGDGFVLVDLGSRNKTFLNDEPVSGAVPIRIGDKIQVGDTMFSFLTDRKEETPHGLVGKTVGGYQLLDRIGRGGMGTVFKAKQLSLNRDVALKVLGARLLTDPDFVTRFQNEARAAGQLNHPNIVQVYDVGASQGLHYFSMEFMELGSVQDQIGKDGRIPWAQALDMMIDAARGLVYAERNEIVHRDIKPDNLMLSADGSVKIGDLGLATRKEDGGAANSKGSIFGTPHFISPEQAQGLEVGHAADMYSLGATFYRILSGRTPFLGEQVQAIIRQQIVDDPPPLRDLAPDVPQAIASVISRLMRKDPAARYPSAADLVEELEAIRMTHHPAMRAGRKGRLALILIAAAVVLGVIGLLLFLPKDNGSGGGGTIIIQGTAQGTVQNHDNTEQAAELRRAKAKTAWLEATRNAPDNGRVTEPNHASEAWDKLMTDLQVRVIEPYGDTPSATEATEYCRRIEAERKTIRERIAAREREEARRTETTRAALKALEEIILDLVAKKRFSEALAAWESAETKQALLALAETKGKYLALEGRILGEARTHATAVLGEVDRLEASGDVVTALKKLEAFLASWNPRKRRDQVFARVRTKADERKGRLTEAIKRSRVQDLSHDFDAYLAVYRRVRHLGEEEPNPVFRYDFARATTSLKALLSGDQKLRSWPYRNRLQAKIDDLDRMERFMVTLVEALKSGRAMSMDLQVEGMGTLTSKGRILADSVTREGFTAEFAKSARVRMKKDFEFADFTPRQIWEIVLLKGERIPLGPRDRLDLAVLLAEIGAHDHIKRNLDRLGPVADLPADLRDLATATLARLDTDLAAASEYAAIRTEKRRSNLDAEMLTALDQRLRRFEETHARSDFFLLIGGSPPARLGLVPAAHVQRYLDGFDGPEPE